MTVQANLWRGRRVLVTGCTGFLGGAVTRELLVHGAAVVGLIDNRPAEAILGSDLGGRVQFIHGRGDNVFRLHSAMAVHEVAAVFHFADRDSHALVEAVNLYSRLVPVVTARPLPQLALARTEEPREKRLTVVRFGELFGPTDRDFTHIVPVTAVALHKGEAVPLLDGPTRDFVFVRDAARGCLLAAEATVAGGLGDYSFRSGWLLSPRQMASAVREVFASRTALPPDSAAPTNPLGWKPEMSFASSISETLAWYRTFLEASHAAAVPAAA